MKVILFLQIIIILQRPIYNKKRYIIPDYFKSYYKFEINGNIVNELFINMKSSKIK